MYLLQKQFSIEWLFKDPNIIDIDFEDIQPSAQVSEQKKFKLKWDSSTLPPSNYLIALSGVGIYGLAPVLVLTSILFLLQIVPYQTELVIVWLAYMNILLYWLETLRLNGRFCIRGKKH